MLVAVINKSTLVSNHDANLMALAVGAQMCEHVAMLWDRLPPSFGFYANEKNVPVEAERIVLFDNADTADALGWHTEGPDGKRFARVFCSPVLTAGGGILDGGQAGVSIASVLSHEAAEMFVDPSVNVWVDGPEVAEGSCYALEAGDPVEGDSYLFTLPDGVAVLVSNFVGPLWFDEQAPNGSRLDWMGKAPAPFQMTPGGYQVIRKEPGSEQSVFAAAPPPEWRRAMKGGHPAGRSARRGAAPVLVV